MLTSAETLKTETHVRDGRPGSSQTAQPQAVLRDASGVALDPCPPRRCGDRRDGLESRAPDAAPEDVHGLFPGRASPTASPPAASAGTEKSRGRAGEAGRGAARDRGADGHP